MHPAPLHPPRIDNRSNIGGRSMMEQEGRLFVEGINVLNACDGCDGRLYRGVLLLLPMT